MSLPAHLNPTLILTIIAQLSLLFVVPGTDLDAARAVVAELLADYNVDTNEELALAADRELPLNLVLRLQSSAISMSREANKAQRALDRLRRDRFVQAVREATEPSEPIPAQATAIQEAATDPGPLSATRAQARQAAAATQPTPAKTAKNPGKYNGLTYTQDLRNACWPAASQKTPNATSLPTPPPSPRRCPSPAP
jgi:hypothetical protein